MCFILYVLIEVGEDSVCYYVNNQANVYYRYHVLLDPDILLEMIIDSSCISIGD